MKIAKIAGAGAVVLLLVGLYDVATPETVREASDETWSETVTVPNEAMWRACVDAAWYNDDPSDATLQECDAKFGDMWVYGDH